MTNKQDFSRTKIIGTVTRLVLVVLFFITVLPGSKQPVQAVTCPNETVSFEFSGLLFCFEKGAEL